MPIRTGPRRDMAAYDLPRSPLLLLIITLFIAALSSSVNATTAGTFSGSSVPSPPGRNPPTESPSSTIEPSDATGDKKALQYSSVAEGGPILISTPQHGSIEITTESNKFGETEIRENAPMERYASPSVAPRKEAKDKIKARKGVPDYISTKIDQNIDQNIDPEKENVSFNQTTFENTKPIVESSPVISETSHIKSEISNISTTKLNATNPHSDSSLNHGINSGYSNSSPISANETTSHPKIKNSTTTLKTSSHIEKHIPKPKPTVTTVDGPEINESIPLSRTKNPPLGMPRKIDYIVPVIITIVALPILGAAVFVLYRRGRDCWDKRHYRRMDFLIDGMYND
ncbi:uncharacterized protein LOC105194329 isoform X1 [Solenopsis invicta]|uniref:uncharacterized protein LOC105194329 isoform X1 n=1 Tax=Solenopsis invicta TaxID=13686 RepID=UPI0005959DD4|nr:uncharacterized protein LOC105194329 isoform X1 [Solenopsis invicta]